MKNIFKSLLLVSISLISQAVFAESPTASVQNWTSCLVMMDNFQSNPKFFMTKGVDVYAFQAVKSSPDSPFTFQNSNTIQPNQTVSVNLSLDPSLVGIQTISALHFSTKVNDTFVDNTHLGEDSNFHIGGLNDKARIIIIQTVTTNDDQSKVLKVQIDEPITTEIFNGCAAIINSEMTASSSAH